MPYFIEQGNADCKSGWAVVDADGADGATGATGSAGSSSAHNNFQPYVVLNYMIKI